MTKHSLIVGSYSAADQAGIRAFTFDSESGDLTQIGRCDGITNPSYLVVHPNGRWLYTVSEMGMVSDQQHGAIWALHIGENGGDIRPLNQQSSAGDWPCHLAIDASGRWLIASNYGSGDAALFPIVNDGSLGEIYGFVRHEGSGPNKARQEGPHAHSATFTPDNNFVIIADLGIDQLVIYSFDAESGAIARHSAVPTHGGAGPRHCTFAADGQHLYVANELDSTVSVFAYPKPGVLEPLQTLPTIPHPDATSTVADIHLSADGRRLYVSNRGHNSIAVFAVNDDGTLSALPIVQYGGNWPRNFALAPDGGQLLVANRRSNDIMVLPIDAGGTELGAMVNRVEMEEPSCIVFMPPII